MNSSQIAIVTRIPVSSQKPGVSKLCPFNLILAFSRPVMMPYIVVSHFLQLAHSANYISGQDSNFEAVPTQSEGTTASCSLQLPVYVAVL